MRTIASSCAVAIAFILLGPSLPSSPQQTNDPAAVVRGHEQQFVQEIISNELNEQRQDHSLWQFKQDKDEYGRRDTLAVFETERGDIDRLIAINGQPLTAEQARTEDVRIAKLISDPKQIQAEEQERWEDQQKELRLLRMLPNAFRYQYASTENGLIKLNFTPDPAFHSTDHESQVFHELAGAIWFDPAAKRLAHMEGRLLGPVKFGWGILGHLDEGGAFSVTQQDVGSGFWEMTDLDVHMNGKALFFKTISVKQDQHNFDYKPVPSTATLVDAARVTRLDSTESASRTAATPRE
ncbi:MAG TPA: hypothetical protein VKR82_04755 [Candidatus Acidoferrales bacterium]|nr:hypothetical protein [Candidatus Acidoferrales bacterium]